jgi:hypothetical protein
MEVAIIEAAIFEAVIIESSLKLSHYSQAYTLELCSPVRENKGFALNIRARLRKDMAAG